MPCRCTQIGRGECAIIHIPHEATERNRLPSAVDFIREPPRCAFTSCRHVATYLHCNSLPRPPLFSAMSATPRIPRPSRPSRLPCTSPSSLNRIAFLLTSWQTSIGRALSSVLSWKDFL
eukprot:scaffold135790_cov33-Tisochrysis_lutea.AAC.2